MPAVSYAVALIIGLGYVAAETLADEAIVFSGPQAGESLVPFDVQLAYSNPPGKKADLVEMSKGRLTLLIFVHKLTRPSTDLTRVLIHFAEIYRDNELFCAQVILHEDRSYLEQYLGRTKAWWDIGSPIGISLDGAEGPGAYGLNRNVTVTVLIAKENVVTANHAIVQPGVVDAPKIIRDLAQHIRCPVPTNQELALLRSHSNQLPIPKSRESGHGPRDPHLRKLICHLLHVHGDEAATGAAKEAIVDYVAGDMELQGQLAQSARLVLRHRYGGQQPISSMVPRQSKIWQSFMQSYGRQ